MKDSGHRNSTTTIRFRYALALLLLGFGLVGTGCAWLPTGDSTIRVTGQSNQRPAELEGSFDRAYYRAEDQNTVTVVLIQGPVDRPEQAVTLRMFWRPRGTRTPVDPTATNTTVQYLVFAEASAEQGPLREVGVYAGAGFMVLDDDPGDARLSGALREAQLALTDRSDRFNDLLGKSLLRGSFTARRDEQRVAELLGQLQREVSDRLQYPRLVQPSRDDLKPLSLPPAPPAS